MVGGTNAAVASVQHPVTPPKQTTLTLSGTITGNYVSLPTWHLFPGGRPVFFVPVFNMYRLSGNGPITITPPGGNPVTLSAEGSISLPRSASTRPIFPIVPLVKPLIPIFPGGGSLTLSQKPTPTLIGTGSTNSTDLPIASGNALFLQLSNPTTSLGKSEFNFTIVGGIGSYLEAKGTGKGVLTLTPDATVSMTPVGPSRGTFSLTLSLPTTGTA